MSSSSVTSISVVGLGKLGSCLAATLSNAGFSVVGADIDESIVSDINAGEAPFPEPKLEEYLSASDNDIRATTDTKEAVLETDVTFIVVDTPSTDDGRYALDIVNEVCEDIGAALAEKDDYHLVTLSSTVFPASTTGPVKETLERASGKTAGADFGLCYSPEFIAIGEVIHGLEDPDFFLVGEYTERGGAIVEHIYDEFGGEESPVARMTPVDAEIAKMAVNSYVTMKISYVNTLAEICDGMGGDVNIITDAITIDSRINSKYFSAGARFGGPCFPRDNVAFSELAREAGTRALLAESTDQINSRHTDWIADIVRDVTPETGTVGILGMTYKPGTYIVVESQGVKLTETLLGKFEIACHDPMGLGETRAQFGERMHYEQDVDALLSSVDTAVIATPWDQYTVPENYDGNDVTLVDPWRLFDDSPTASVAYVPVGNGRHQSKKRKQSARR